MELFCHAHHVGMDLLSFIHDLIWDAIGPQTKSRGLKLEPFEITLELGEVLNGMFCSKFTNVINWLRTTIEITWIVWTLHGIDVAQERCHWSNLNMTSDHHS